MGKGSNTVLRRVPSMRDHGDSETRSSGTLTAALGERWRYVRSDMNTITLFEIRHQCYILLVGHKGGGGRNERQEAGKGGVEVPEKARLRPSVISMSARLLFIDAESVTSQPRSLCLATWYWRTSCRSRKRGILLNCGTMSDHSDAYIVRQWMRTMISCRGSIRYFGRVRRSCNSI